MSLGSRTLGSNTFSGRRPVYMADPDLTTIEDTIVIDEHLNIKYRKILTHLWARQDRQSTRSLLLVEAGEYLLHETNGGSTGRLRISNNSFERTAKQTANWTEQSKQSSSWNKISRN